MQKTPTHQTNERTQNTFKALPVGTAFRVIGMSGVPVGLVEIKIAPGYSRFCPAGKTTDGISRMAHNRRVVAIAKAK